MKKFLATVFAVLLVAVPMMAQISEGEPHSAVIPRIGNRPQAGDWGIYLGGSVSQVLDIIDAVNYNKDNGTLAKQVWWGLPLLNLKYYPADQWEVRLGFEFSCLTENQRLRDEDDNTNKTKQNSNFTRFLPGFAYHFNTKNLLDVYVGAQMPIGFDIEKQKTSTNTDGYLYERTTQTNRFVVGGGAFVGLQCFIADLPFAIGVELGYSGVVKTGGLQKTTINDDGDVESYYTVNGTNYAKAQKTTAEWHADAALTFSYFFH